MEKIYLVNENTNIEKLNPDFGTTNKQTIKAVVLTLKQKQLVWDMGQEVHRVSM